MKLLRFAGDQLKKVPGALKAVIASNPEKGITIGDLGRNFGMDAGFAALQAASMPEADLRERLLAAGATALGGGGGGLAASALLPAKLRNNGFARQPAELLGGILGDNVAMMGADQLQRMTDETGRSYHEKAGDEQRRRVEMETLASLGLLPQNMRMG
jgi:hypothetical protein